MNTRLFLYAAIALISAIGDAVAADTLLTKIRIADHDTATRVVLEFDGVAAPKGQVSQSDNRIIVEMNGVRRAKQVASAAAKSALVADHALTESKTGAVVLVVTTRVPLKLVAAPSILPADKTSGPRLYFDLERDTSAKPTAAAASAAAPAAAPATAAPAATTAAAETAVPPDLEKAAKAGDLQAQMTLAGILGKQEKYAQSLQWYRAAAEQGNGPAAYNVGQYLRVGMGVPADPAAAFKWSERSAAAGFPRGQYATALMLMKGDAVPPDNDRAQFLLQQAAAAGVSQAQALLQSQGQR